MIRVVVGIVKRGETALVAERPLGRPYAGYWEFPGGKIEAGETSSAALRRELHEELGIDVVSAQFLFNHQYTYPDKTVFLDLWLVTDFSGELHGKENQQLRWATIAEMMTLNMLEGNWPIIAKIKSLFHA